MGDSTIFNRHCTKSKYVEMSRIHVFNKKNLYVENIEEVK